MVMKERKAMKGQRVKSDSDFWVLEAIEPVWSYPCIVLGTCMQNHFSLNTFRALSIMSGRKLVKRKMAWQNRWW